ncbi:organic solvent ABC transporter [Thalassospira profundimaris]|uniref:Organic solvent ABC transporter n=1 Tax=Thalassospira profundimaris TaxID=502049 RepID=A0A367XEU1_9PROT|nr:ATP-binding cassette domain-containing protein [Thalassospira profundimaris]RCK51162.1 organic solvent ABC transporter [Thalassospira profundimaris]
MTLPNDTAQSPANATSPFLKIKDLVKKFGDTIALDHVSLSLDRGQKMAVIGPSAAGKSVLLKCLAGVYRADSGNVLIDGVNIAKSSDNNQENWADRIGMLFQQNALFDSLPIWQNVCFQLIENGTLGRKQAKDRAVELLGLVGLDADSALLHPSDLSGGMQKRVGIARAIANSPEILLLDNPTAGLDPVLSNHIENMIDTIARKQNTTVITVTNDMEIAQKRYDFLTMMHEGKVYWHGKRDEISAAQNDHLAQMLKGSAQGPISMRTRNRGQHLVA